MYSGSCWKTLSQHGVEKHQRNSISVFVELLCTLDSRPFFWLIANFGSCPARHEAEQDQFFHATDLFPWHCVTFVNFCTPNWSQDFVLFRGIHEDLAARRPEALLTNCHACSTPPLNFLSLIASAWLFISQTVHSSTLFTEFTGRRSCAITIQASTLVEIVFKWMLVPSVLSNLPPIFSSQRFAETWNFLTLYFFKYTTPSGRASEFQSMVSSGFFFF